MIPDFISAIYLWVTDKIGGPYPLWRSWLVPVCLFILFVGISILFMTATAQDEPPPASIVAHQIEIEILKSRLATAEANIVALAGTVNKLVVAINRIEPAPSIGNLATRGELDLLRLEVKMLKKELTRVANIYGHYSDIINSDLDEMKLNVGELKKRLTAHTANTTIHWEKGGD